MKPTRYSLPVTTEEQRARGFDQLNYTRLREILTAQGWRQQEHAMYFPEHLGDAQCVEWWNRGPQVLLIHREDDSTACTVFIPTRARRAQTFITRKTK